MALTTAEKQKRFRERMKEENRREIRGIYATPEHAEQIKNFAAQLLEADTRDSNHSSS